MITKTMDVELLDQISDALEWKVELDMEGNYIVSPETNPHFYASQALHRALVLSAPVGLLVGREGPPWSPLATPKPTYIPDLAVVDERSLTRTGSDYGFDVPPLLVVEILSPSSRRRDLTEKSDIYYAGGAQAYWTVEVPALTGVAHVELTTRIRGDDGWNTTGPLTGLVDIDFPFSVTIDLATLATPK